jgi:hypothetical protein
MQFKCTNRYLYFVHYLVFLNSSIHFDSTFPLGRTTNVKQPSFNSSPSCGSPSRAFADLQTSRNVIFLPTLSNRFLLVIAYILRFPVTYSPLTSHSGGGAEGGNMVSRCAVNGVSSAKWDITSDVAYCGYKKNTGRMSDDPVGSSGSKCGSYGFCEASSCLGTDIKLRSYKILYQDMNICAEKRAMHTPKALFSFIFTSCSTRMRSCRSFSLLSFSVFTLFARSRI